jgi:hypothetical protein
LRKGPSTIRKTDVYDLTDEDQEEVGTQSKWNMTKVQTTDTAGTERMGPPKSKKRKTEAVEAPGSSPSTWKRRQRGPPSPVIAEPMTVRGGNVEQQVVKDVAPKESPIKKKRGRPRKSSVAKAVIEKLGNAETRRTPQGASSRVGELSRQLRGSSISPRVISDEGEQGEEETEGSEGTEAAYDQSSRGRATQSNVQTRSRITGKDQRRPSAASSTRTDQRRSDVRAHPKGPTRRVSDHETVPILVHRLSTRHNGDYVGEDAVFDPIPPHSNRAGVNAVDVLSQICRELITGSVEKLRQGAEQENDNARLREWKRKRKAIEAFGEELEERLFEMVRFQLQLMSLVSAAPQPNALNANLRMSVDRSTRL